MKSAGNWSANLLRGARLVRIAPLGEGHGAGVEPAVDHFADAAHALAGGLGRVVGDGVDVGLVDLEVLGEFGVGLLGAFSQTSVPCDAGLGEQFVVAADGLRVAGLLADPDRQRRAPVALAREGPVDVGLEEVAEAAVADVLRQPVDLRGCWPASSLETRGADEPALARILDERVFVGSPAEGIIVEVLLLVEQQPALLQCGG